jgi:aminopeptidase N
LVLPTYAELADRDAVIDTVALADARDAVMHAIAHTQRVALNERYARETAAIRSIAERREVVGGASDAASQSRAVGHRALANGLLAYLNIGGNAEAQSTALAAWSHAENLTDVIGAMLALRDQPCAARDTMYQAFHDRWQNDLSMLNRWFQLESCAHRASPAEALKRVRALLAHPKFDGKNPNRVRSVVHSFGDLNWRGFHAADGAGYAFIAEQIVRFDAQNPSLAARFCDAFSRWHRCAEPQRSLQKKQLETMAAEQSLSANVREIIEKTLKSG